MCTWRLSNHPLRSSDVLTRRRPSLTRLRQTMAVPRLSSHWTAITSARLTYNSKRKKNISKMEINQTIRICVLFPPIPSHSVLVIASLPPIHPSTRPPIHPSIHPPPSRPSPALLVQRRLGQRCCQIASSLTLGFLRSIFPSPTIYFASKRE